MATFRLVLPHAPWLSCLHELRACYGQALRDAGHPVTYADWYLNTGERGEDHTIAFGAHAVAPPPHCGMIIAQSEHHVRHFTDDYAKILHDAALVMHMGPFDDSVPLDEDGGGLLDVVEVPPGITPVASKYYCDAERNIDVLFYGSITPRRARILEALSAAGVQVCALYGVLGAERDRYIDRAKLVLDLKQEGDEPDDQTRAFWSLSRGACTLSENAPRGCLARITPEDVVTNVKLCLGEPEGAKWRARLLEQYRTAMGPCDVSPLLKALGL